MMVALLRPATASERKGTMLSIRSMIERFRETKPTSRQEREKMRKQTNRQELLWRERRQTPAEDVRRNSFEGGRRSLPDRRREKSIRWADVEARRFVQEDMGIENPDLSVEELMSQDIARFVATEVDTTNRSPKAPRVSPSLAPVSHLPSQEPMESYPRGSLVLPSDSDTRAAVRDSRSRRGPEEKFDHYLRDSLALDPNVYTGSAELRGNTSPVSPRPTENDESGREGQDINMFNKDMTGVTATSAADVTADLNGVLNQIRNGMIHGEHVESPGTLTPRDNLPVNLTQIAHDLDAKLLEFTLMAKAREQVADEAKTAVEAEKGAWRKEETKRVEDMVRQEHATLQDAVNRTECFSLMAGGVPESFGRAQTDTTSLRHPSLPPSALGRRTFHWPEQAIDPLEDVAHQMAVILRAVEAKVRRIEALEVDRSRGQENGDARTPSDDVVDPTKSWRDSIGSPPCTTKKEDETARDSDAEARVHGNEKPVVTARDQREFVVGFNGTLTTDGGLEIGPIPLNPPDTACGGLPGRLFLPTEDPVCSRVLPRSWLDGQVTLHEAGQSIGAELEVAMLCMQKRLGKQPIIYCEQDAAIKVEDGDRASDRNLPMHRKDPQENVPGGTEVGGTSEGALHESLEEVANDMVARRERKTHIEVDRELGLVFGDDPDFCWRGRESATYRMYHDTADPTAEIGSGAEASDMYSPKQSIRACEAGGAPPAPVLNPAPRSKVNQCRLAVGSDMLIGNSANARGLDMVEEPHLGRHMQRHDEDGRGFAVARARQRLSSFRAARQSMSMATNGTANNAVSEAIPPLQEGAKAMLGRLKQMRHSLLA